MKQSSTAAIFALTAFLALGANARADMPVVVELFTSQGCSSCPPADALLGEMALRDDVIALSFHVDYWNYIGWVDPFSSPAFTQRQRNYATLRGTSMVYTPQAMIQGVTDVIGSRRADLENAIVSARAANPVTQLNVLDGGASVDLGSGAIPAEPLDIVLVAYSGRMETEVTRGENAGRALTEFNIVRSLQIIGTWDGTAQNLPVDLAALEALGSDGFAIFLQGQQSGQIFAAVKWKRGDETAPVANGDDNNAAPAAGTSGSSPDSATASSGKGTGSTGTSTSSAGDGMAAGGSGTASSGEGAASGGGGDVTSGSGGETK